MFGTKALSAKIGELEARIRVLEQRPVAASAAADGGGAVAQAWGMAMRERIEKLESRLDELERQCNTSP